MKAELRRMTKIEQSMLDNDHKAMDKAYKQLLRSGFGDAESSEKFALAYFNWMKTRAKLGDSFAQDLEY